jgi:putative ATP-dependent endonuclease of OLD family
MRVRAIEIWRFRGIKHVRLTPGSRNVLLGPNNSGKSTILEALDLVLYSGLGRPRPAPTEVDYFARDPTAGFRIEVVLGALDTSFLALVRDHLEGWDSAQRVVTPSPDGVGIESAVRIAAVGTPDFELLHQFAKEESDGARVGRDVRGQVGWVFDGRLRDPSRQLAFYQGGLLDQLFGDTDLGPAVDTLRLAVADGAKGVNADGAVRPELEKLGQDLIDLGLLEPAQAPAFEMGSVSERELLQALRLGLPSPHAASIPIERQGRGAQRLLLTATLMRISEKLGRPIIGGFEEPEEALEPLRQAQLSRMIRALAEADGQVFIVTHSPDIVRSFSADDLLLVEQSEEGVEAEALSERLTPALRQAYERRIWGPIVGALFARVAVLGEGPGDVAVFDTFWEALARERRIEAPADQLGIAVINCEGAPHQPMVAAFLHAARRTVVVWAEADVPDTLAKLESQGNCDGILYHDSVERDLEGALVAMPPIASIAAAMRAVAVDRGYEWAAQRVDLLGKGEPAGLDAPQRAAAAAATELEDLLAAVPEASARRLAAAALRGSGVTPFEIKGARPARIFAEAIVHAGGVPENFARPLVELAEWLQESPRSARGEFRMHIE